MTSIYLKRGEPKIQKWSQIIPYITPVNMHCKSFLGKKINPNVFSRQQCVSTTYFRLLLEFFVVIIYHSLYFSDIIIMKILFQNEWIVSFTCCKILYHLFINLFTWIFICRSFVSAINNKSSFSTSLPTQKSQVALLSLLIGFYVF